MASLRKLEGGVAKDLQEHMQRQAGAWLLDQELDSLSMTGFKRQFLWGILNMYMRLEGLIKMMKKERRRKGNFNWKHVRSVELQAKVEEREGQLGRLMSWD